ncbi:hypothetical protein FO519_004856 [Halicephalobus sp. NKZ332]|nr:hypothetical protein FO519_004856 [Halicephalobus sp. NKZ332]
MKFLDFTLIFVLLGVSELAFACPVCNLQGQWSEWSGWSLCAQQYGAYSQTRTRTCSNNNCYGGNSESIACVTQHDDPTPQGHPEWNPWGSWNTCSASCGGGLQYRQRTCNTNCGVCQCQGAATDQRECNKKACCHWKKWSPWSECSVTCGSGGIQSRTRECTCSTCPSGLSYEQKTCSGPACPSHCPVCDQPPTPPPCSICNQPPPPCSACGYYGRKKRQETLEKRKMINSMVIPPGTNFTTPLTSGNDSLPFFIGFLD